MKQENCKVRIFCENCNFDGEIELPKDFPSVENQPCPACGSKSLVGESNLPRFLPQIPRKENDPR